MFSGKTSELISRYNRYTIGKKKCLMIKYKNDTRYDKNMIVTHDGIKISAVVCKNLYEVDHKINNYDVICIDEVQFYKDADIFCDKWATENNKIVEACGLNSTFERKPFPIISNLIPLVEDITFLTAICKENGNDAVYSKRLIDDKKEELIGGSDVYSAVDRETYFKDISTKDNFQKFIKIYNESHNIKISKILENKFIRHFESLKDKNKPYRDIILECFKLYGRTARYLN